MRTRSIHIHPVSFTTKVMASLALAASLVAAPVVTASNTAEANVIQSPSFPELLGNPAAKVTQQVREDSSKLPVIWVGGSIEYPGINTRARSYFENHGLDFYEWNPMAATIQDPNLGVFDKIKKYSPNLDAYVRQIMAETGAPQVNMVTYSQGGLIAAGWMRENNNAEIVDKVVNISGLLNGTPIGEVASYLPGNCLGIGTCQDFNPKGEFIGEITNPGALPGVEYLNIDSRTDILAGPYTNNLMTGAGEYQNVLTEDLCAGQFNVHMSLGSSLLVHEAIVQFFRGQEVAPSCIY